MTLDYVETLNQNTTLKRQTTRAILEVLVYTLNKDIMNELNRSHHRLDIYTDHREKQKKEWALRHLDPQPLTLALRQ